MFNYFLVLLKQLQRSHMQQRTATAAMFLHKHTHKVLSSHTITWCRPCKTIVLPGAIHRTVFQRKCEKSKYVFLHRSIFMEHKPDFSLHYSSYWFPLFMQPIHKNTQKYTINIKKHGEKSDRENRPTGVSQSSPSRHTALFHQHSVLNISLFLTQLN